jgi:ribosomal protein S18 acetylase RimI-like enzyme
LNKPPFRITLLDPAVDRSSFDSGTAPLDAYFQRQVTQDVRRRVTACFVALTDEDRVAGYYTLASTSVLLAELPASVAKKLPRYPLMPAVRMGRLAVDREYRGRGLGGALLADALDRATRAEIAAFALLVDAKDDAAAAFYRHHRFIALSSSSMTLYLPLATSLPLMGD